MVAPGEPLWLDDDRLWAVAYLHYLASLCPGCGLYLPDTLEMRDGRHVHRWETELPEVCGGCIELAAGTKDYDEDPRRPAMRFRLTQVE